MTFIEPSRPSSRKGPAADRDGTDAAMYFLMRSCSELTWSLLAMSGTLVSAIAASALVAEQEPAPASANYSIKLSVRRVLVDVVVTKPEGGPLSSLVEKDFSVTEDGVVQQILSFDAHNHDSSRQTLPSNLPTNTFVNLPREPDTGPLYLLLYDLANCDIATQMFARQQLVKFINERPPGTRVAILALSDGTHLIQGFTADKRLLSEALDTSGKTPHMPKVFLYGGNYGAGNPRYYVDVMKEVGEYIDGLPGRKNLIWISNDFPFSLFAPDPPDLIEATRKELTAMAARQISIYPVDASGIEGVNKKTVTLDEIAWETGGHAFYNSNDVAGSLDKAVADGATYYTLSYSSINRNYDGKLRHIQVELSKGGYRLSYRRQYYADADALAQTLPASSTTFEDASTKAVPQAVDSLSTFVRHGMPMNHEILFSAHPQDVGTPKLATREQMEALSTEPGYFRTRQKGAALGGFPSVLLQSYAIAYAVPVRQFRPAFDIGNTEAHTLEFAAAAYDSEGHLLNGNIVHAATAPEGKTKYYQVVQPFDVPTNARWICVAVRDAGTGRIGNLEFALPLTLESPAK